MNRKIWEMKMNGKIRKGQFGKIKSGKGNSGKSTYGVHSCEQDKSEQGQL